METVAGPSPGGGHAPAAASIVGELRAIARWGLEVLAAYRALEAAVAAAASKGLACGAQLMKLLDEPKSSQHEA